MIICKHGLYIDTERNCHRYHGADEPRSWLLLGALTALIIVLAAAASALSHFVFGTPLTPLW